MSLRLRIHEMRGLYRTHATVAVGEKSSRFIQVLVAVAVLLE